MPALAPPRRDTLPRELRGLAFSHIKTARQAVTFIRGGSAVLLHLERALVELRRLEIEEADRVD